MDDLMFSYQRAVLAEAHRQGRAAQLRRRALIHRRARRRLAKAQRTALQARLVLGSVSEQHALVPDQQVP